MFLVYNIQHMISEIFHEKTELELRERIGSFSKGTLYHIEPLEKTVLPTEEGTDLSCFPSPLSHEKHFPALYVCIMFSNLDPPAIESIATLYAPHHGNSMKNVTTLLCMHTVTDPQTSNHEEDNHTMHICTASWIFEPSVMKNIIWPYMRNITDPWASNCEEYYLTLYAHHRPLSLRLWRILSYLICTTLEPPNTETSITPNMHCVMDPQASNHEKHFLRHIFTSSWTLEPPVMKTTTTSYMYCVTYSSAPVTE